MNRKKKLLILLMLSLSVFFVYKLTDETKIIYTVIGDYYSNGENSYGGYTYGYEDYFLDYLKRNNQVEFNDLYTSKNQSINTLYNTYLKDETKIIDNKNYNLKKILTESKVITISIGLNDIIYEHNINKNGFNSQYIEDKTIEYIYNNFKNLMNEILKYSTNNIYILGYPERNSNYKSLISKLNIKYKEFCNKEKLTFIDSNKILNKEKYFDIEDSIFPNTSGYKKIAQKIIEIYKNKEKS